MGKVIINCDEHLRPFIKKMCQIKLPDIEIMDIVVVEKGQKSVDRILSIVRRYPDEVTIVALAELTTIAEAITQDMETMEHVKELLILGGSEKLQGDYSPVAERNFGKAPEAAKAVFEWPVRKRIMVGLDVTEGLEIPTGIKKAFTAFGILAASDAVESKEAYVEIETEGIAKGQSVCDIKGGFHEGKVNTTLIHSVDDKKIFSRLFREE